jgi:uncharacterized protein (DUF2141 family)
MIEKASHVRQASGANRLAGASKLPLGLAAAIAAAATAPAAAQQVEIANDLSLCSAGAGPALLVTVSGIKASKGKIRVQSYRATRAEWLERGKWINRIEVPAKAGTMTFCMPVPQAGTYGIAVRHDINGNGKTDLGEDGGGISNNPAINIFNLGKPSHTKVGVEVANAPRAIQIQMKYM